VLEFLIWLIKLPFVLIGVVVSVIFGLIGAVLGILGAIASAGLSVLWSGLVLVGVVWLMVVLFRHTGTIEPSKADPRIAEL